MSQKSSLELRKIGVTYQHVSAFDYFFEKLRLWGVVIGHPVYHSFIYIQFLFKNPFNGHFNNLIFIWRLANGVNVSTSKTLELIQYVCIV